MPLEHVVGGDTMTEIVTELLKHGRHMPKLPYSLGPGLQKCTVSQSLDHTIGAAAAQNTEAYVFNILYWGIQLQIHIIKIMIFTILGPMDLGKLQIHRLRETGEIMAKLG